MTSVSSTTPPFARRFVVAMTLLVVAVTGIAYLPALRGGFIFDDEAYVVSNIALRSAAGLRAIWFGPTAGQYYPLVFTSFWVEYHLWGLVPLGYHAMNVALHAANALLLWTALRRLRVPGALLAACIFAVHPVHVDSVAWITERKDVLSALFYLLALVVWLRFVEVRSWQTYAGALALFTCAMLSKSITCTLPLALLLVAWWREEHAWRRELLRVLPFLAIGVALGLITIWCEHRLDTTKRLGAPLPYLERAFIAAQALWFYAGKLIWPRNLMALYPHWEVDRHAALPYFVLVGTALVPVIVWGVRNRIGKGPIVAVMFFALTLAPALGLVRFDFQRLSYVADHFQYLASIGLIALFAALLTRSVGAWRGSSRWVAHGTMMGIVFALAMLTWRHAGVYADEEMLWRDNVAKNPRAVAAQYNLGKLLLDRGHLAEAIQHFAAALEADPHHANAQLNWGVAADRLGRLPEAIDHYQAALRADPANAPAHSNLATALFRTGNAQSALEHFAVACRIDPSYAEARNNWGLALALQGRLQEAVQQYAAAVGLQPDFADAHRNLGDALIRLGLPNQAVEHLRVAVQLRPNDRAARTSLQTALELQRAGAAP